jgi:DNA-binding NarL/FixJ family response regulator
MRAGLSALLSGDDEIEVVGEYAALSGALRQDSLGGYTRDHGVAEPDVIVLASLESSALPEIQEPDQVLVSQEMTPVLYLLGDEAVVEEIPFEEHSYAWGLLPLNSSAEEISAAVHALSEGLWVGSPAMLEQILKGRRMDTAQEAETLVEPLTERETEVLQLLAQGLANKQIAMALGISEHTVKFHVSAIYAKLGTTNRTEAVRVGIQKGLVLL